MADKCFKMSKNLLDHCLELKNDCKLSYDVFHEIIQFYLKKKQNFKPKMFFVLGDFPKHMFDCLRIAGF